MLIFLVAALGAFAAEPGWVTTVDVALTAGAPADRCTTTATFPPPPPRVERPEVEDPRTRGMLRVDTAPGAPNADLPADLRVKVTTPVDLAALPAVPLGGDPAALRRVADALARASTRPVRVAMWGDSLTAADVLPSTVRRGLQARYGDAGRGFVLPAPPWAAWNPADVVRCAAGVWRGVHERTKTGGEDGRYGWAGLRVEASDAGTTAWLQTPLGTAVSAFELHYLRQPGGGALRVQVDDAPPVEIATAAAEPGPGALRLRVPEGPHRLSLTVVGDGPVGLFGVHLDREGPGIGVDGMGVGGRTASAWTTWDEPLMAALLDRRAPDLVLVEYGTNETTVPNMTPDRYREELRGMLGKLRRVLPDAACVLVAPPDRGHKVIGSVYAAWPHIAWVTRIQSEEAPTFGCATWSMQSAMGGFGSTFGWRLADPSLMSADYLHLTPKGYQELGRRLADALIASGS